MDPWAVFAVTAAALFVKMQVAVVVQGIYRLRHRVFTRPEDAACWSGELADRDVPIVARAQRVLGNDLENAPIFLFLSLAYIHLGGSGGALAIYSGLFVATRIAHTGAYLVPRQPLRNRAYSAGVLTTVALAGHAVYMAVA